MQLHCDLNNITTLRQMLMSPQHALTVRENAGWSASAISEGASWTAQPGSYYRMSRNWAGNDRLTLEISSSGKGSTIVATYRSSNPEHLKPEWTSRLWKQIPEVASGSLQSTRG